MSTSIALKRRFAQQGLQPGTRKKYEDILKFAPKDELIDWIYNKIGVKTPLGTVLPLRAAVTHYLVAEQGYKEDELKNLLPPAKGRKAKIRHPLTVEGLAIYLAAVQQIGHEPAATILALLPETGLRIGEITKLTVEEVRGRGQDVYLQFYGKGDKERVVPLNGPATRRLDTYIGLYQPKHYLFPGRSGAKPITEHAIRKYTRALAKAYPEDLKQLSPHMLRYTAASMWLRDGVDTRTVQVLLGHSSITTTQRYAQPGLDVLKDAVSRKDRR